MKISTKISNYLRTNLEYIIFFALLAILVYHMLKKNWEGFYNEQNGINRLDAIIYINLENRGDRKDLLMKELEKLNTNMAKVHKVSGVYIPKNGHKGCVQSHILALNMIKMNKWKRVLILEDDAELNIKPEIFNDALNKALDALDNKHPEWNVIMLATANKVIQNENNKTGDDNLPPLEIETADGTDSMKIKIEKLKSATTSSAYIVKDTYVDNILDLFKSCNNNMKPNKLSSDNYEHWALDQKWAEIQGNDNWYCFDKDLIKQRAIWSTIMTESHK